MGLALACCLLLMTLGLGRRISTPERRSLQDHFDGARRRKPPGRDDGWYSGGDTAVGAAEPRVADADSLQHHLPGGFRAMYRLLRCVIKA